MGAITNNVEDKFKGKEIFENIVLRRGFGNSELHGF